MLTHFITQDGIPVDDSTIVAPEFKSKPFRLTGQWSLSGDTLSIVTEKPSVHPWRVLAITGSRLVLRHVDTQFDKSTDMFWVKSEAQNRGDTTK
jgi:hypothetical protein